MDRLDPTVFKRMFRVDRASFNVILELIEPFMEKRDEQKATNSSGCAISLKTRLAVTLRWLAGGSHLDICFAFGVANSTFFSHRGVLWPTVMAINEAFTMSFPHNDPAQLEEMSNGFFDHSGGVLDGCLMAIDGFGVKCRCPYKSEDLRRKDYRFCKGGFAIIVLAGCDVNARFIFATANHSGSTNDIYAWQDSDLYQFLEVEGSLPPKYFFIGDEAFTNTQQFLSPWPGRGLDRYKDSFNYWLSHSRQCVERSFGMLTKRFGIFWRPLICSMDKWSMTILVCMKLHNFCLSHNDGIPTRRWHEDVRDNDEWGVYANDQPDDFFLRGRARGDRRRDITQKLELLGVIRPLHAMANSRTT
jgi:hypothetical protein